MQTNKQTNTILLVIFLCITFIVSFNFRCELGRVLHFGTKQEPELKLFEKNRNNFVLKNGDEYKLINSAIKQDYTIFFSGNIVNFDTLVIGKGIEKYLSSYLLINHDSIIFNSVDNVKKRKAYKHYLKLKNSLSINIDRKLDSTIVTIINEKDTCKITSDFVGMNNPFIRSMGSLINVDKFEFICNDYYSDVYVFGDSYVNCASPKRWPYYLYNKGYTFLCDGLPGGKSIDSYDFISSALTVHKPKYLIWCLGMNDGSDKPETSPTWKYYLDKVVYLCNKNNITLILATVPSVPTIDNTGKNKFVRESGYRYIEFDKAVSDSKGNWKRGMLSNDGVHPAEMGAKAMAEQLLKDFPEIKNSRYSTHSPD